MAWLGSSCTAKPRPAITRLAAGTPSWMAASARSISRKVAAAWRRGVKRLVTELLPLVTPGSPSVRLVLAWTTSRSSQAMPSSSAAIWAREVWTPWPISTLFRERQDAAVGQHLEPGPGICGEVARRPFGAVEDAGELQAHVGQAEADAQRHAARRLRRQADEKAAPGRAPAAFGWRGGVLARYGRWFWCLVALGLAAIRSCGHRRAGTRLPSFAPHVSTALLDARIAAAAAVVVAHRRHHVVLAWRRVFGAERRRRS